jgi:hypothetical protein
MSRAMYRRDRQVNNGLYGFSLTLCRAQANPDPAVLRQPALGRRSAPSAKIVLLEDGWVRKHLSRACLGADHSGPS